MKTDRFNKGGFHVSFDADLLYPSLIVAEGLEILNEKLNEDKKLHERTDLSKQEIMRLSHLCTSSSYFQCEHGIFAQTKGAPIGGPLSGLLGDLVIENLIEKKITSDPKWGPIWDWVRMADDTFLEWTLSLDELTVFHEFLNNLHPTIKWSKEIAKNNSINFLDVLVIREGETIQTTVYRKPSASNRYLHYTSFQSMNERFSALKTLRNRAEEYCSTNELKNAEFQFLTETFLSNGFPLHTIENVLYNHSSKQISNEDQQNPADYSNSFMVPYYPAANSLVKKLKKKFNISTVFSKTETLGHLLQKKTHQPVEPMKKKGAIYAYPCEEKCSIFYIGQTKRAAFTRIKEEKTACKKASKDKIIQINGYNDIGYAEHHLKTGHNIQFDKAKVVELSANHHKRMLLEGLFIERNWGKLMNMKKGTSVDPSWLPLLNKLPDFDITKYF
jgi:hypothetical protein